MVIRKMDYERFINTLTTIEERYIRFKVVDELAGPQGGYGPVYVLGKATRHQGNASRQDQRPFHGLNYRPIRPWIKVWSVDLENVVLMEVPMCDHDGLDWEDIALAGAFAKEIAEEEKERERLRKEMDREEDEDG